MEEVALVVEEEDTMITMVAEEVEVSLSFCILMYVCV